LKYTNIIKAFRHRLAISKYYIQYFGCTDRRLDEREREREREHFLLNVTVTVKESSFVHRGSTQFLEVLGPKK